MSRSPVDSACEPGWLRSGRIPCLDGLRAISILLVLGLHLLASKGATFPRLIQSILWRGAIGVDIFFAISGFLITLLMLRESNRTGTVSIRSFYLRRAFRILPAYCAYLGFVSFLTLTGAAKVTRFQWMTAMTYTTNCWGPNIEAADVLLHTWSLSTEEHFYLLWPIAFLWLGRRAAFGPAIILIVEPLIRLFLRREWGVNASLDYFTLVRLDSIAAGCLLAYFVRTSLAARIGRALASRPVVASLAVVVILGLLGIARSRLAAPGLYSDTIGRTVEAALILALIFTAVSSPRSPVGRLFESRPMVAIGLLSYSLYLWQQPFLFWRSGLWFHRWPVNIILTFTAAIASYLLIERPFLRLKHRMGKRRH